ncbi:hypothetical protein A471_13791 [Ectopseudomonas mendocina DLHK]|nr:hypothetical protein A471_13791 [Pseudomonas mendocina DLHK]
MSCLQISFDDHTVLHGFLPSSRRCAWFVDTPKGSTGNAIVVWYQARDALPAIQHSTSSIHMPIEVLSIQDTLSPIGIRHTVNTARLRLESLQSTLCLLLDALNMGQELYGHLLRYKNG